MASIPHFEDHHKSLLNNQLRKKLSLILLSLTGLACLGLLFMLGKSM